MAAYYGGQEGKQAAQESCTAEYAVKKGKAGAARAIGQGDVHGFAAMEPGDKETQKILQETVNAGATALSATAKAEIIACVAKKMADYGRPPEQSKQPPVQNFIYNDNSYRGGYDGYYGGGYPYYYGGGRYYGRPYRPGIYFGLGWGYRPRCGYWGCR